MKKSPLDFCSISDRSVSSGGTLLPWVSITALASLGAVKPTLGSKVPPLETLLPDMEKNLRDFSFPMMERDKENTACINGQKAVLAGSLWIYGKHWMMLCLVTIESRTQYVLTEAATEKEAAAVAVVVVLVLLHPKHTRGTIEVDEKRI